VFPQTTVQLCIVHMIRNSLKYVAWKDYKNVVRDLNADSDFYPPIIPIIN